MIKNYFLIAIRNILRQKTFSTLNLVGLSLGIACCLLLTLYIDHEVSYDKDHNNAAQLYRLKTIMLNSGGDGMSTGSPAIPWALKDEVPEIKNVTRVVDPPQVDRNLLRYKDKMFYETKGYLVDSTFFDFFTFNFLEGSPNQVFARPNTVVLKEKVAKRLFGNASPIGELITIINGGDPYEYEVTGVLKDKQQPSHIDANFYINMNSPGWGAWINGQTTWAGQNFVYCYVELREDADRQTAQDKINNVVKVRGAEYFKAAGFSKSLELMPVEDIHLYGGNNRGLSAGGSIEQVTIITLIGLFILIIACVNFINLSTAQAGKRAREIGVRKTLGAQRSALIGQFYLEVFLFTILAAFIGFLLMDLSLPYFNYLTGKSLPINALFDTKLFIVVVSLLCFTAFIAGSYPSILLSSYNPAKVLKQSSAKSAGKTWLRTGLVIFQFVISISLIGAVAIMLQQMNYINNFETGYSTTSKIVVPTRTSTAKKQYPLLKNKLSGMVGVRRITATDYLPGDRVLNDFRIYTKGETIKDGVITKNNKVDNNYFDVLNIKLIAGRKFSENDEPENNVIINRKAALEYGFEPEEAIGKKIYTDSFQGNETYTYTIVGVVEDFNQLSLHYEIQPLLLYKDNNLSFDYMMVEIDAANYKQVNDQIEGLWSSLIQDTPLEYYELDARVRQQYETDQKAIGLISTATTIAIIISCLGLFGLSLFAANQRQKELSIRKVFGASLKNLVGLQYKGFLIMIGVALLIAVPAIYFGMESWLKNYAYRIEIGASTFVIAGIVALIIGGLTISFQAIKVALTNPVDTLRNE